MAKFEGIHWAERQMRFGLVERDYELLPAEDLPDEGTSGDENEDGDDGET